MSRTGCQGRGSAAPWTTSTGARMVGSGAATRPSSARVAASAPSTEVGWELLLGELGTERGGSIRAAEVGEGGQVPALAVRPFALGAGEPVASLTEQEEADPVGVLHAGEAVPAVLAVPGGGDTGPRPVDDEAHPGREAQRIGEGQAGAEGVAHDRPRLVPPVTAERVEILQPAIHGEGAAGALVVDVDLGDPVRHRRQPAVALLPRGPP